MRFTTALLAACFCASFAHADVPPPPKAGNTVYVKVSESHGSGFHIGDGFIVTAAHVIGGEAGASVEFSDGKKAWGTTVLVDLAGDLAFLEMRYLKDLPEVAGLACRVAVIGENVRLIGNPLDLKFVSFWGRISGEAQPIDHWRLAQPINLSSAPGTSGGPIFDERGKVIGVLVAGASANAYSLSVPSLSVCRARDYLGLE